MKNEGLASAAESFPEPPAFATVRYTEGRPDPFPQPKPARPTAAARVGAAGAETRKGLRRGARTGPAGPWAAVAAAASAAMLETLRERLLSVQQDFASGWVRGGGRKEAGAARTPPPLIPLPRAGAASRRTPRPRRGKESSEISGVGLAARSDFGPNREAVSRAPGGVGGLRGGAPGGGGPRGTPSRPEGESREGSEPALPPAAARPRGTVALRPRRPLGRLRDACGPAPALLQPLPGRGRRPRSLPAEPLTRLAAPSLLAFSTFALASRLGGRNSGARGTVLLILRVRSAELVVPKPLTSWCPVRSPCQLNQTGDGVLKLPRWFQCAAEFGSHRHKLA